MPQLTKQQQVYKNAFMLPTSGTVSLLMHRSLCPNLECLKKAHRKDVLQNEDINVLCCPHCLIIYRGFGTDMQAAELRGEWVYHEYHAVFRFSWHTMPHTLGHASGSAQPSLFAATANTSTSIPMYVPLWLYPYPENTLCTPVAWSKARWDTGPSDSSPDSTFAYEWQAK